MEIIVTARGQRKLQPDAAVVLIHEHRQQPLDRQLVRWFVPMFVPTPLHAAVRAHGVGARYMVRTTEPAAIMFILARLWRNTRLGDVPTGHGFHYQDRRCRIRFLCE